MTISERLSPEEGVIYPSGSFATLIQRAIVLLIDGLLLLAVLLGGVLVAEVFEFSSLFVFQTWCVAAWLYLTVIKTSRWGTLGYALLGLRIVTLRGERPSILRMTFRLLLTSIGPFSLWVDLPWIASDKWRQSLRDKLAATYVIHRDAVPTDRGVRRAAHYGVMGYHFVCWEIRPQTPSST